MYAALYSYTLSSYPKECVWNNLIPLKVSFFMWELWWDKTPRVDNLIVGGMILTNRCCLCLFTAESSGHLFMHCPWVGPFWSYLISRFGVAWVQASSVRSLIQCWQVQYGNGIREVVRSIWKVIPSALCWIVWEERNMRTFEDKSMSPRMIIDAILSMIYDWVFVGPNWERFTIFSWIFD